MFSLRIVSVDHYLASPICGLDPQYSSLRGSVIKKCPVIRIYGSTSAGQKACLHVHGVFPYMFVPYDGCEPLSTLSYSLASAIDKALNLALGQPLSDVQHVYKIHPVSGIPFYGYHKNEHQFLKIFFYNPLMVRRAAELLQNGAIHNKVYQPYEAHIPYALQFFMDFNLYGMNYIHLLKFKFRTGLSNQDERFDVQCFYAESDSVLSDELPSTSLTPNKTFWYEDKFTSENLLKGIHKITHCELELDASCNDILNRKRLKGDVINPGLAYIWDDEARRMEERGELKDAFLPPLSPERTEVLPSESESRFMEILCKKLIKSEEVLERKMNVEFDGYPVETPDDTVLLSATNPVCGDAIHQDLQVLPNADAKNNKTCDDINEDLILSLTQGTQHSWMDTCDKSFLDVMVKLAENSQPCSLSPEDADAILSSQKASEDANENQEFIVQGENSEDEETDHMSQIVWDSMGNWDSNEMNSNLPQLDGQSDIVTPYKVPSCVSVFKTKAVISVAQGPQLSKKNNCATYCSKLTYGSASSFAVPQFDGGNDFLPTKKCSGESQTQRHYGNNHKTASRQCSTQNNQSSRSKNNFPVPLQYSFNPVDVPRTVDGLPDLFDLPEIKSKEFNYASAPSHSSVPPLVSNFSSNYSDSFVNASYSTHSLNRQYNEKQHCAGPGLPPTLHPERPPNLHSGNLPSQILQGSNHFQYRHPSNMPTVQYVQSNPQMAFSYPHLPPSDVRITPLTSVARPQVVPGIGNAVVVPALLTKGSDNSICCSPTVAVPRLANVNNVNPLLKESSNSYISASSKHYRNYNISKNEGKEFTQKSAIEQNIATLAKTSLQNKSDSYSPISDSEGDKCENGNAGKPSKDILKEAWDLELAGLEELSFDEPTTSLNSTCSVSTVQMQKSLRKRVDLSVGPQTVCSEISDTAEEPSTFKSVEARENVKSSIKRSPRSKRTLPGSSKCEIKEETSAKKNLPTDNELFPKTRQSSLTYAKPSSEVPAVSNYNDCNQNVYAVTKVQHDSNKPSSNAALVENVYMLNNKNAKVNESLVCNLSEANSFDVKQNLYNNINNTEKSSMYSDKCKNSLDIESENNCEKNKDLFICPPTPGKFLSDSSLFNLFENSSHQKVNKIHIAPAKQKQMTHEQRTAAKMEMLFGALSPPPLPKSSLQKSSSEYDSIYDRPPTPGRDIDFFSSEKGVTPAKRADEKIESYKSIYDINNTTDRPITPDLDCSDKSFQFLNFISSCKSENVKEFSKKESYSCEPDFWEVSECTRPPTPGIVIVAQSGVKAHSEEKTDAPNSNLKLNTFEKDTGEMEFNRDVNLKEDKISNERPVTCASGDASKEKAKNKVILGKDTSPLSALRKAFAQKAEVDIKLKDGIEVSKAITDDCDHSITSSCNSIKSDDSLNFLHTHDKKYEYLNTCSSLDTCSKVLDIIDNERSLLRTNSSELEDSPIPFFSAPKSPISPLPTTPAFSSSAEILVESALRTESTKSSVSSNSYNSVGCSKNFDVPLSEKFAYQKECIDKTSEGNVESKKINECAKPESEKSSAELNENFISPVSEPRSHQRDNVRVDDSVDQNLPSIFSEHEFVVPTPVSPLQQTPLHFNIEHRSPENKTNSHSASRSYSTDTCPSLVSFTPVAPLISPLPETPCPENVEETEFLSGPHPAVSPLSNFIYEISSSPKNDCPLLVPINSLSSTSDTIEKNSACDVPSFLTESAEVVQLNILDHSVKTGLCSELKSINAAIDSSKDMPNNLSCAGKSLSNDAVVSENTAATNTTICLSNVNSISISNEFPSFKSVTPNETFCLGNKVAMSVLSSISESSLLPKEFSAQCIKANSIVVDKAKEKLIGVETSLDKALSSSVTSVNSISSPICSTSALAFSTSLDEQLINSSNLEFKKPEPTSSTNLTSSILAQALLGSNSLGSLLENNAMRTKSFDYKEPIMISTGKDLTRVSQEVTDNNSKVPLSINENIIENTFMVTNSKVSVMKPMDTPIIPLPMVSDSLIFSNSPSKTISNSNLSCISETVSSNNDNVTNKPQFSIEKSFRKEYFMNNEPTDIATLSTINKAVSAQNNTSCKVRNSGINFSSTDNLFCDAIATTTCSSAVVFPSLLEASSSNGASNTATVAKTIPLSFPAASLFSDDHEIPSFGTSMPPLSYTESSVIPSSSSATSDTTDLNCTILPSDIFSTSYLPHIKSGTLVSTVSGDNFISSLTNEKSHIKHPIVSVPPMYGIKEVDSKIHFSKIDSKITEVNSPVSTSSAANIFSFLPKSKPLEYEILTSQYLPERQAHISSALQTAMAVSLSGVKSPPSNLLSNLSANSLYTKDFSGTSTNNNSVTASISAGLYTNVSQPIPICASINSSSVKMFGSAMTNTSANSYNLNNLNMFNVTSHNTGFLTFSHSVSTPSYSNVTKVSSAQNISPVSSSIYRNKHWHGGSYSINSTSLNMNPKEKAYNIVARPENITPFYSIADTSIQPRKLSYNVNEKGIKDSSDAVDILLTGSEERSSLHHGINNNTDIISSLPESVLNLQNFKNDLLPRTLPDFSLDKTMPHYVSSLIQTAPLPLIKESIVGKNFGKPVGSTEQLSEQIPMALSLSLSDSLASSNEPYVRTAKVPLRKRAGALYGFVNNNMDLSQSTKNNENTNLCGTGKLPNYSGLAANFDINSRNTVFQNNGRDSFIGSSSLNPLQLAQSPMVDAHQFRKLNQLTSMDSEKNPFEHMFPKTSNLPNPYSYLSGHCSCTNKSLQTCSLYNNVQEMPYKPSFCMVTESQDISRLHDERLNVNSSHNKISDYLKQGTIKSLDRPFIHSDLQSKNPNLPIKDASVIEHTNLESNVTYNKSSAISSPEHNSPINVIDNAPDPEFPHPDINIPALLGSSTSFREERLKLLGKQQKEGNNLIQQATVVVASTVANLCESHFEMSVQGNCPLVQSALSDKTQLENSSRLRKFIKKVTCSSSDSQRQEDENLSEDNDNDILNNENVQSSDLYESILDNASKTSILNNSLEKCHERIYSRGYKKTVTSEFEDGLSFGIESHPKTRLSESNSILHTVQHNSECDHIDKTETVDSVTLANTFALKDVSTNNLVRSENSSSKSFNECIDKSTTTSFATLISNSSKENLTNNYISSEHTATLSSTALCESDIEYTPLHSSHIIDRRDSTTSQEDSCDGVVSGFISSPHFSEHENVQADAMNDAHFVLDICNIDASECSKDVGSNKEKVTLPVEEGHGNNKTESIIHQDNLQTNNIVDLFLKNNNNNNNTIENRCEVVTLNDSISNTNSLEKVAVERQTKDTLLAEKENVINIKPPFEKPRTKASIKAYPDDLKILNASQDGIHSVVNYEGTNENNRGKRKRGRPRKYPVLSKDMEINDRLASNVAKMSSRGRARNTVKSNTNCISISGNGLMESNNVLTSFPQRGRYSGRGRGARGRGRGRRKRKDSEDFFLYSGTSVVYKDTVSYDVRKTRHQEFSYSEFFENEANDSEVVHNKISNVRRRQSNSKHISFNIPKKLNEDTSSTMEKINENVILPTVSETSIENIESDHDSDIPVKQHRHESISCSRNVEDSLNEKNNIESHNNSECLDLMDSSFCVENPCSVNRISASELKDRLPNCSSTNESLPVTYADCLQPENADNLYSAVANDTEGSLLKSPEKSLGNNCDSKNTEVSSTTNDALSSETFLRGKNCYVCKDGKIDSLEKACTVEKDSSLGNEKILQQSPVLNTVLGEDAYELPNDNLGPTFSDNKIIASAIHISPTKLKIKLSDKSSLKMVIKRVSENFAGSEDNDSEHLVKRCKLQDSLNNEENKTDFVVILPSGPINPDDPLGINEIEVGNNNKENVIDKVITSKRHKNASFKAAQRIVKNAIRTPAYKSEFTYLRNPSSFWSVASRTPLKSPMYTPVHRLYYGNTPQHFSSYINKIHLKKKPGLVLKLRRSEMSSVNSEDINVNSYSLLPKLKVGKQSLKYITKNLTTDLCVPPLKIKKSMLKANYSGLNDRCKTNVTDFSEMPLPVNEQLISVFERRNQSDLKRKLDDERERCYFRKPLKIKIRMSDINKTQRLERDFPALEYAAYEKYGNIDNNSKENIEKKSCENVSLTNTNINDSCQTNEVCSNLDATVKKAIDKILDTVSDNQSEVITNEIECMDSDESIHKNSSLDSSCDKKLNISKYSEFNKSPIKNDDNNLNQCILYTSKKVDLSNNLANADANVTKLVKKSKQKLAITSKIGPSVKVKVSRNRKAKKQNKNSGRHICSIKHARTNMVKSVDELIKKNDSKKETLITDNCKLLNNDNENMSSGITEIGNQTVEEKLYSLLGSPTVENNDACRMNEEDLIDVFNIESSDKELEVGTEYTLSSLSDNMNIGNDFNGNFLKKSYKHKFLESYSEEFRNDNKLCMNAKVIIPKLAEITIKKFTTQANMNPGKNTSKCIESRKGIIFNDDVESFVKNSVVKNSLNINEINNTSNASTDFNSAFMSYALKSSRSKVNSSKKEKPVCKTVSIDSRKQLDAKRILQETQNINHGFTKSKRIKMQVNKTIKKKDKFLFCDSSLHIGGTPTLSEISDHHVPAHSKNKKTKCVEKAVILKACGKVKVALDSDEARKSTCNKNPHLSHSNTRKVISPSSIKGDKKCFSKYGKDKNSHSIVNSKNSTASENFSSVKIQASTNFKGDKLLSSSKCSVRLKPVVIEKMKTKHKNLDVRPALRNVNKKKSDKSELILKESKKLSKTDESASKVMKVKSKNNFNILSNLVTNHTSRKAELYSRNNENSEQTTTEPALIDNQRSAVDKPIEIGSVSQDIVQNRLNVDVLKKNDGGSSEQLIALHSREFSAKNRKRNNHSEVHDTNKKEIYFHMVKKSKKSLSGKCGNQSVFVKKSRTDFSFENISTKPRRSKLSFKKAASECKELKITGLFQEKKQNEFVSRDSKEIVEDEANEMCLVQKEEVADGHDSVFNMHFAVSPAVHPNYFSPPLSTSPTGMGVRSDESYLLQTEFHKNADVMWEQSGCSPSLFCIESVYSLKDCECFENQTKPKNYECCLNLMTNSKQPILSSLFEKKCNDSEYINENKNDSFPLYVRNLSQQNNQSYFDQNNYITMGALNAESEMVRTLYRKLAFFDTNIVNHFCISNMQVSLSNCESVLERHLRYMTGMVELAYAVHYIWPNLSRLSNLCNPFHECNTKGDILWQQKFFALVCYCLSLINEYPFPIKPSLLKQNRGILWLLLYIIRISNLFVMRHKMQVIISNLQASFIQLDSCETNILSLCNYELQNCGMHKTITLNGYFNTMKYGRCLKPEKYFLSLLSSLRYASAVLSQKLSISNRIMFAGIVFCSNYFMRYLSLLSFGIPKQKWLTEYEKQQEIGNCTLNYWNKRGSKCNCNSMSGCTCFDMQIYNKNKIKSRLRPSLHVKRCHAYKLNSAEYLYERSKQHSNVELGILCIGDKIKLLSKERVYNNKKKLLINKTAVSRSSTSKNLKPISENCRALDRISKLSTRENLKLKLSKIKSYMLCGDAVDEYVPQIVGNQEIAYPEYIPSTTVSSNYNNAKNKKLVRDEYDPQTASLPTFHYLYSSGALKDSQKGSDSKCQHSVKTVSYNHFNIQKGKEEYTVNKDAHSAIHTNRQKHCSDGCYTAKIFMYKCNPPSFSQVSSFIELHELSDELNSTLYVSNLEDISIKKSEIGVRFCTKLLSNMKSFEGKFQNDGLYNWKTLLTALNSDDELMNFNKIALHLSDCIIVTPLKSPPSRKDILEWLQSNKGKNKTQNRKDDDNTDNGDKKKHCNKNVFGSHFNKVSENRSAYASQSQNVRHSSNSCIDSSTPLYTKCRRSLKQTSGLKRHRISLHVKENVNLTLEKSFNKLPITPRKMVKNAFDDIESQRDLTCKSPYLSPITQPKDQIHATTSRNLNFQHLFLSPVDTYKSESIDGPSLSNTYGFKMPSHDLRAAKAVYEHEWLTLMCLECHIKTRKNLLPDPEFDDIVAVVFSIMQDVPENYSPLQHTTGTIVTGSELLSHSDSQLPVFYAPDEKTLMTEIVNVVRKWDPDILLGFEVQKSSWGYLIERGNYLNFNISDELSRLCVDDKKVRKEMTEKSMDDIYSYISGRIILNVWRIMRHEVTLTSYTLENVAFHILHSREPSFSYDALTAWWEVLTTRWRVLEYYSRRCHLTLEIIKKLDLVSQTSELARLFGIQFYDVLSRGSQFRVESMMLRLTRQANMVALSPDQKMRATMQAPEWIPLTLEPQSRMYLDPVVVLDFQSLYPSVMIAYNYCFSTCLGRVSLLGDAFPFEFGTSYLKVSTDELRRIIDKINISPCGVVFVQPSVRKGILPKMLEDILTTRIMVKNAMKKYKANANLQRILHSRQLGLKLIANVTYGYTSANFSGRMPCIEVGDSVVSKGRETLENAIKLVNNNSEWKAKVVYGDTDSLFVHLPGRTKEEAFNIGAAIAEKVTNMNPKPVKLKFEKVYQPCILQSKKRYVGYMYESVDQNVPIYDAKGIETVRRDGCPAVAKILEKCLHLLFEEKNISRVKSYIQHQFTKIMGGKVSIQDFIFAKEYRGRSGYKPRACVPALHLARQWTVSDRRKEPLVGERVPYVIVYGAPGLPLIRLVRSPHIVLEDPSLQLNSIYYITHCIIPPLNRCFSLIGIDIHNWYSNFPRPSKNILVGNLNKSSSVGVADAKKTLLGYFKTVACVVCGELVAATSKSSSSVCDACKNNPQKCVVVISEKLRNCERSFASLVQICQSCLGYPFSEVECVSLDCPILFKRSKSKHELNAVDNLHKVLSTAR